MRAIEVSFLACLSLLLGCQEATTDEIASAEAYRTQVKVATVARTAVERVLEVTGSVEAGRAASLMPTATAQIKSINVVMGQAVREGQLLARMDVDVAQLQLQQAKAGLGLARLGLESAKKDLARAESLRERESIAQLPYEQAQTGLKMASEQLNQASAGMKLAQKQVEGGVLKAPFDGVVALIAADEGDWFSPMGMGPLAQSGLIQVVDLRTLKIDVRVSESAVVHLKTGMQAQIFVDSLAGILPAGGLVGTIESVGLAAAPDTRTFPVRIVADNPDQLVRAGSHARVRLLIERKDGVIAVPNSALLGTEGNNHVALVQAGRAVKTPVTPGMRGAEVVEIASGLIGGEQVVIEGGFGLADGALVETRP